MKKQMLILLPLILAWLSIGAVHADSPAVYVAEVEAPLETVYPKVHAALEENRFFVVFEANIGRNIARFAERWGEDYNRSGLDEIRSMVVCNGWYANQVSNKDPDMLALCPLRLTLTEKGGVTRVLFARPTVIAAGSPALDVLREVEHIIIKSINEGIGKK